MDKGIKKSYMIFIWHGFFLTLTMSMIDFNTVFPSLISTLVDSKIIFGLLYSIMLGVPKIFNIVFSHFMNSFDYRKKFLLIGIYLRALSFLGMAAFTYFFGESNPELVVVSFFFWVFVFSISGGFAGMSYSDIIGKTVNRENRGKLYASKQFASSLAALFGGLLVQNIFSGDSFSFPFNYSLTLSVGFIGLVIAAIAFWFIKEPPSINNEEDMLSLKEYIKNVPNILKADKNFIQYIIVENMASFSLMLLPFYIVYARETFGIGSNYIGKYLLYQISGTIISNLLWGYISDKFDSKIVVRVCVLGGAVLPLIALGLTPAGPEVFAIIFFLIGFLISGRKVGFEPYLLNIAPDDRRTVYLGIRGTLNFFVVLLPFFGGVFINYLGYIFTFILVSIIMFTAFYLMRKKPEFDLNS
ncbi:MAG: MFS transporter [Bacillota bacterium]